MANKTQKTTHSDRSIRKARKQRRDHSAIVPLRVSIADMARIIRSDAIRSDAREGEHRG